MKIEGQKTTRKTRPLFMKVDRRKTTRYPMSCGVNYAYHAGSYLVGRIVSLSEKGLAFEYESTEQRTTDTMILDILSSLSGLSHLTQITCVKVYDISDLAEGQSFRGTAIRRCGIQFFNLTTDQRWDIDQLISHQTSTTSDTCGSQFPT